MTFASALLNPSGVRLGRDTTLTTALRKFSKEIRRRCRIGAVVFVAGM